MAIQNWQKFLKNRMKLIQNNKFNWQFGSFFESLWFNQLENCEKIQIVRKVFINVQVITFT